MSKNKEKAKLHDDVYLTSLQSSIEQLSNKIDAIQERRIAIENKIINNPSGIANLKQFIKLNQLEKQEKQLVARLEQMKYTQSLITPKRNIPNREKEEFDEWRVVDQYNVEKSLSQIREARQNRENNKEIER